MNIRLISEGDFEKLYATFKTAFSDNSVKFQPTKDEFSHRIHKKILYNMEISAGSFDGDEMTGFILHTSTSIREYPPPIMAEPECFQVLGISTLQKVCMNF